MAISLAMAAISTGVLAGTAAITGVAATYLGGSMVAHFLITAAMGVALNALSPKPDTSKTTSRGYSLIGSSGAALDHQIIYGEVKVGGVFVYDCTTGSTNQYLHRIIAFAGHQIDSYQTIYIDDVAVTLDGTGNVTSPTKYNGFVRIKKYLGTTGQIADIDLINDTATLDTTTGQWTVQHTLSGIAYLYIRLLYDSNVFPNGIPVINTVIRGKPLYDPRTTLTTWSKNTALCIRDYMTSDYGMAQLSTDINDTYYNTAANICDQSVASESRYTCSGAFTTAVQPNQIISDMLSSMGGLFWNSEGTWKTSAAAYSTPTLTLNEDDLRSGISVSTRNSRRDNFNAVKGTFVGVESNWQEADYPQVSDPAFLIEDNNITNTVDLVLPFTKTSKTAQRIARIFLFRNREQISVLASFGLRALNCQIGDNIMLSVSRFGWSSKVFEVTDWNFSLNAGMEVIVNLTLRETDPNVFNDVAGSVFALNNTTLPSPYTPADIGLTLTSSTSIVKESVLNVLSCNVTSTTPSNIAKAELAYKLSTDTNYKSLGFVPVGTYDIVGIADGSFDVRVRSYNYFGYISDWVYSNAYVINNTLLSIQDVSGFSGDLNGSSLTLRWVAVNNPDLSYYKIRHTTNETGSANWADALTLTSKVARPGVSHTQGVMPGTYLIKAYNKSGISSQNAATFVVKSTEIETFVTNTTQVPAPTFAGTLVNTSVSLSKLIITDTTSTVPSSGTYTLSSFINTGAVRKFRSRIDVTLNRLDNSAGLMDNLTGQLDDLEGLWDALGTTSVQGDVNVRTYISTTQTNPTLTPVWTAYTELQNGQYTAWAARFQLVLSSNSSNVTPAVSAVTAIVQY